MTCKIGIIPKINMKKSTKYFLSVVFGIVLIICARLGGILGGVIAGVILAWIYEIIVKKTSKK